MIFKPQQLFNMLLSFVIPTYNRADKVVRAIESVLKQPNFADYAEIVVVDDGSTDNTLSVLENYISNKQIRLIRHDHNKGVAPAKNTGILNAKHKYVVLLDSDDLLSENGIVYLVEQLKDNDTDLFFAGIERIRNGELMYNPSFYGYKTYQEMITEPIGEYLPIGRTEVLQQNLLENLRGFEGITWLKIARKGYKVYYGQQPIVLCDDIGEDRLSNRFSGFRNAKKMKAGYKKYLNEFRSDLKRLNYKNYLKIRFKSFCYTVFSIL